ncbi:MAG TPA: hypothetical protein VMA72_23720 [Streptosporangiaceae bacterium]|nr:hypothetical protein [Streptosporangiaceae bacterium]
MTGSGTDPADAAPGPDDINNRLDEIAAELATEAKFKELSAAERAEQARRAERRSRPRPAAGRGQRTADGRPRGRTTSLVITFAVIAALIAVSFGVSRLHLTGHGAAKPDNTPVTASSSPAAIPTVTPPPFTSADPFAGSPAVSFADGASGIVIPAAHRVGSYSAAQVRAAYVIVRKMLIASHLNASVLGGGKPTAFARLLTSTQRSQFERNLNRTGSNSRGFQRSTRTWVTSFAAGTTELVGNVIKVRGQMSAGVHRTGHVRALSIHADYLFVYPVQQEGGQPSTRMRIVDRAYLTVLFAQWTDPGGPLEPWFAGDLGGPAGVLCGINDGFVHPAFPGGPQSPVRPSGTPINPYDLSKPPLARGGCQATTGT